VAEDAPARPEDRRPGPPDEQFEGRVVPAAREPAEEIGV
jgi:hypothetical protein